MHLAQRMQAGPDLEWRLEREVALLDIEHPDGFAVRLHELGDFYSVEYVKLWGKLLECNPGLHIWGLHRAHRWPDCHRAHRAHKPSRRAVCDAVL